MKIWKLSQSARYLYRGAPSIQKVPSSGGQIGVFVTTNPEYARTYGDVINTYTSSSLKILDANDGKNRKAIDIVEAFFEKFGDQSLGAKNDPWSMGRIDANQNTELMMQMSIFLYPNEKWKDWVMAYGYNATSNSLWDNPNICIFDSSILKFVGVYDLQTKSIKT